MTVSSLNPCHTMTSQMERSTFDMKGHIAIIDSDPVFARSMSQRLLHLFPLAKINLYAPEDLESDPLLELTEETILYDETRTDQAALNKHTGSSRPARF